MFSMKRILLGGAAGTAAALLVISAAWACSPYSRERPSVAAGPAGTSVVINGFDYEAEYGAVTVELTNGSSFGTVLATPVLEYTRTWTEERVDEPDVVHTFHQFTTNVTVPDGVNSGFLFVFQRTARGDVRFVKVFDVTKAAAIPPTSVPQPLTPTTQANLDPTVIEAGPSTTAGPIAPDRGAGAPTRAAVPRASRSAAPGAAGVTVEVGGTVVVGSEVPLAPVTGSPEGLEPAPWLAPADLAMESLWSGLEKYGGGSGRARLDGDWDRREDESSRLGVGLFALGTTSFLAGALGAATSRRRATARSRS